MYFDLHVPIPQTSSGQGNKKGKGKQTELFFPAQIQAVEAHVDLLVHLGYTVIGLAQTVHKRVDKTHINALDILIPLLRKRTGVLYLKRLNIILDEDSEKGFGLINASTPLFDTYDIIALMPTTHATLSLACLTHSQPSPLTAHIIALPLTLPRLPFHLKHTLVRTAIKNGVVFEINYVGAIGGEHDPVIMNSGAAEAGASAKRNWWAAARELVRVTKGKGLLLSGGVSSIGDLRAPRDIGNIATLLDLPQDATHAMSTTIPKSLVLRAQTRKTYRAVFSEPKLIIPASEAQMITPPTSANQPRKEDPGTVSESTPGLAPQKRARADTNPNPVPEKGNQLMDNELGDQQGASSQRKKRKKNKERNPNPAT